MATKRKAPGVAQSPHRLKRAKMEPGDAGAIVINGVLRSTPAGSGTDASTAAEGNAHFSTIAAPLIGLSEALPVGGIGASTMPTKRKAQKDTQNPPRAKRSKSDLDDAGFAPVNSTLQPAASCSGVDSSSSIGDTSLSDVYAASPSDSPGASQVTATPVLGTATPPNRHEALHKDSPVASSPKKRKFG